MTYKLFIDDQAFEKNCPGRQAPSGYEVATSCDEAIMLVEMLGPPSYLDLDHDLADGKDIMSFLRWLANQLDHVPEYIVHSRNPVGRDNIISFMESWRKSLTLP